MDRKTSQRRDISCICDSYGRLIEELRAEISEETRPFLEQYAKSGKTLSDWLDEELLRDDGSFGWGEPINTYPFGKPTDKTYNEFFGVSAGKTTLRDVLNRAKDYCERASKELPTDEPKTVVILTEKWDTPMFRRLFDKAFRYYALEYNIWFIFILVTDYGMTRIPFLAWDRDEFDIMRRSHPAVDWDVNGAKGLLQHSTCEYRTWSGTLRQYDVHNYTFDFEKRICEIEDIYNKVTLKKIPVQALNEFAVAVRPLYNRIWEKDYCFTGDTLDTSSCEVSIFGGHLEWKRGGTSPNGSFERVVDALEKLLEAIGVNNDK